MSKKDRKAMKRGANASKSGPGATATRHEHEHEQHAGTSRFDQVKRSSKDKDTTYAQVSHGTDVADKDRRPAPKPAAGSTSPARIHAVSPSRGGKSSGAKSVASSPKIHGAKHAPKSPKSPLHDNHHRHARAHKPTAMDDTDYFLVVKNRDPVVFPGFRRSYFGAIGTDVDDSAKKRSVPLTRDASMLMK